MELNHLDLDASDWDTTDGWYYWKTLFNNFLATLLSHQIRQRKIKNKTLHPTKAYDQVILLDMKQSASDMQPEIVGAAQSPSILGR